MKGLKRAEGRRKALRLAILAIGLGTGQAALGPFATAAEETFIDGLAAYDAGDVARTVRIWRMLAQAGDARAQVGLAGLHLAGSGVARNPAEAARLYRLAAEQGDSNGQLNLGRLLLDGVGIDADIGEAYAWLTLAARQGRRWAEEKRLEIQPSLTDAQRTTAADLIADIESR